MVSQASAEPRPQKNSGRGRKDARVPPRPNRRRGRCCQTDEPPAAPTERACVGVSDSQQKVSPGTDCGCPQVIRP
ncbi:hypothetical protein ANANG_G00127400 [Anguilla anguilla]|uniref:Uncharacterized protein n=1 Tax=Anguilla anguilla TaxID=7936 RepID=A0A9D3RZZ1_ANGAN|nr:hypothetical protein ANANG_G00127400 [Anguilla anguilla]